MSDTNNSKEKSNHSVARSAVIMTAGTTLSRFTGGFRMMALAWALGVSRLADNFMLANVMPNMIYEMVIGGILSSVLLPVYMDYIVTKNNDEANHVASSTINLTLLILMTITLLGILFPFVFAKSQTLLVKSGDSGTTAQVAFFFRFFIPQIIFYGLVGLTTAILNAHKQFAAPAFAPIANNVVVIATVLFLYAPLRNTNPELALIVLAVGVTMGVVAMMAVQVPFLFKVGLKYSLAFDYKHPAVRKIAKLSLPVLGYVLLNQIGLSVANNLAYKFVGGVAALQLAWPLFMLFYGIFSVSITTVLFPNLSEHWSRKDKDLFKKDISFGIRSLGFLLIPAAATLIVLSEPIIKTLYVFKGGAFNLQAVSMTAPILRAYMLGLFAYGTWVFLTRAFYAFQDTKTPMFVNAVGVPFNVIVDIILVRYMGVAGVALGLALTYTFTVSVIYVLLRRKLGALDAKATIAALLKQLASAAAMSVAMLLVYGRLAEMIEITSKAGQLLSVAIAILSGLIVYLAVATILRVKEVNFLFDALKLRRNVANESVD